jgi:hypothetical protein
LRRKNPRKPDWIGIPAVRILRFLELEKIFLVFIRALFVKISKLGLIVNDPGIETPGRLEMLDGPCQKKQYFMRKEWGDRTAFETSGYFESFADHVSCVKIELYLRSKYRFAVQPK